MSKAVFRIPAQLLFILIISTLAASNVFALTTADINGQVLLGGVDGVEYAEVYYYNPILEIDTTVYTDADGYYHIPAFPLPVAESSTTPVFEIQSGALNSVGSASSVYFLDKAPVENVSVFNILGRKVTSLKMTHTRISGNLWLSTGFWNGKSVSGSPVANGRYFIAAEVNGQLNTVPVIHLRDSQVQTAPSFAKVKDQIIASYESKALRNLDNMDDLVVFDVEIRPTDESIDFIEQSFRRTIHDGLNDLFVDTVYAEVEIDQILFIGNSYTASNGGIDTKLEEMVAFAHPEWEFNTQRVSFGGYTLLQHASNTTTQSAIINGEWDFVFLQEQSYRPVAEPNLMRDGAIALDNLISDVGAETGMFMTWAYEDDPGMIEDLANSYTSIGDELGALVAPVGLAWQRAFAEDPELTLHVGDGSHPNVQGTYLAVCVFYASIFNENPVGYNFMSEELVSIEMQEFLQQIAWETVQDYFSNE